MEDADISKELKKLKAIFKEIPDNKRKLCDELIQNAAFMSVGLRDLQKSIMEVGAVIVGTNGNGFEVMQESPAQRSYNNMVGRYAAIIKQLSDLLPDGKTESAAKAGEALAAFVAKGKR